MIQLNLLPDLKLDYIKAERSRRLAISISFLVSVGAIVLLLVLLSLQGLQNKHLRDLSKDISNDSKTLQKKPQINKILTVQNQLVSLPGLHALKPATPKLFDYLYQVTPSNIFINDMTADFTLNTITIAGTTDKLSSVNKYADTLKFTTYTTADNSKPTPAFSDITLSNFGVDPEAKDPAQATKYTLTMTYDLPIFDNTKKITLAVPSQITTRSLSEPLFKAAPKSSTKTGAGN